MPSESAAQHSQPPESGPSFHQPLASTMKCSICGGGTILGLPSTGEESAPMTRETVDRLCGGCARAQQESASALLRRRNADEADEREGIGLGLGLRDVRIDEMREQEGRRMTEELGVRDLDSPSPSSSQSSLSSQTPSNHARPVIISTPSHPPSPPYAHSHSLPTQTTRPWTTSHTTQILPIIESEASGHATPITRPVSASPIPLAVRDDIERLPNPLLDVTKTRIPSVGRGCLYPGSIFRGTQTSGRSAYEVEVKFLDVNFPDSTLCGYLSISHLTDSHPHLTTFFTGEIIGPKYGFLTGSRFGATEHDDMRHWGRFEQFRRPSTRADMFRPDLTFRDPLPDITRSAGAEAGVVKGKERDFVFLRIKERFLVPDHRVRDISGASFAGFYFALVDLSPMLRPLSEQPPPAPSSPTSPTSPTSPLLRRMSSGDPRGSHRNAEGPISSRTRDTSRSRVRIDAKERPAVVGVGAATIRGYYFHSLNQEPFQELSLTHIPSRSSSTFEMR